MADITMPQLGETVTEGTITKWFKQVGDQVAEDEVLFEVSTDKVDSEVPSPAAGYVAEILVQEGETVDVGTRLAVIAGAPPSADGGAPAAAGAGNEGAAPAPQPTGPSEQAPAGPSGKAQDMPAPPAEERGPSAGEVAGDEADAGAEPPADAAPEPATAEPAPREPAPREPAGPSADTAEATAAGAAGPADYQPAGGGPAPAPTGDGGADGGDGGDGAGAGKMLSPVVRRLVKEHGIDVAQLRGTGAGGRITRADVLAHIDAGADRTTAGRTPAPQAQAPAESPPAQPAAPAPAPRPAAGEEPPRPGTPQQPAPVAGPAAHAGTHSVAAQHQPGERDQVVPFTNIRRRTAEHMVRSRATSAHTLTAIEVDYDRVERARRAHKDRFKAEHGAGLTYLPFIARATIDAIREFPNINSSVGDDQLIVHLDIHLGIAVDLDQQGLIVPVVRNAADKRLPALAREFADLAGRARARKLSADEIQGGTFTITNPGPFGTFLTAPIINQPQVAILSTDGIKKRPVVVELPDGSDGIAIHPTGMLALSFDHRVIDGAYASAFLKRIKDNLEERDWPSEL